MKKILVLVFGLLFGKVDSQSFSTFHTRFGGEDDDVGNCIIQCLDGGYTVVGSTGSFGAIQTDIYISHTNSLAQPVWQKKFGGIMSDVGKSVVELQDSSFVIVGYTNSYGSGGYDAIIIRVDKNGNLIWQKTYGGIQWDFAYSIKKTLDNNLIICGTTYSFGKGINDAFILKMDYSGNFIWSKIYGGAKEDDLKEIIPTKDGGYIAVGTTNSFGDSLGDFWITKFNFQGDSIWFKTHGGLKKEIGNSIVQNDKGDFFVAGGSESYGKGKEDAYIFKLDSAGFFLWSGYEGLPNEDEEVYSVKNSYSLIGGIVFCYTTKEIGLFGKDSKTLLYDSSGNYVNGGRVGSTGADEVFCVANCQDKGYIVGGYTSGFGSVRNDIFIVKFDSLMNGPGNLVSIPKYSNEVVSGLALSPNPFVSSITIALQTGIQINKIEVADMEGTVVFFEEKVNNQTYVLERKNLEPGLYILKVSTDTHCFISKILCTN